MASSETFYQPPLRCCILLIILLIETRSSYAHLTLAVASDGVSFDDRDRRMLAYTANFTSLIALIVSSALMTGSTRACRTLSKSLSRRAPWNFGSNCKSSSLPAVGRSNFDPNTIAPEFRAGSAKKGWEKTFREPREWRRENNCMDCRIEPKEN